MSFPNQAYFIAAQAGVTPLAMGIPGVAKTATLEAFGRAAGRPVYTLIGSLRDPADVGGYPQVVTEVSDPLDGSARSYVALMPPKYAHDICIADKPWVIFIDELTTCPPAVQAALLRVIAEKVIGDVRLPAETWIMAAANPAGVAANGFDIEAPMANRLYHHEWKMDWASWDKGMMAGLDFPAPKFDIVPAGWEKGLAAVATEACAFRRRRPDLFEPTHDGQGNVTLERSKLSGPWPSPRSWTNAVRCVTAARSVGAGRPVERELMAGCIGEGPTEEFGAWLDNLDLPDPEELISEFVKAAAKGRKPKYRHPDRPDKTIAMMGSVCQAVLQDLTLDRWQAAIAIAEAAFEYEPDVAVSCIKPVVTKDVIPQGAKLSAGFSQKIFPMMNRIFNLAD